MLFVKIHWKLYNFTKFDQKQEVYKYKKKN